MSVYILTYIFKSETELTNYLNSHTGDRYIQRCNKMKYAHLSAGFMLTAIIGILVSIFFVWGLSETWGFTFLLFFGIMFIASMISMTKAPYTEKEYQDELAIHEKPAYKRRGKNK
jgi:multisubunit Na+/H+ antiporter MnhB subunit